MLNQQTYADWTSTSMASTIPIGKLRMAENDTIIRYPRFQELHRDLAMCMEMTRLSGEPQCLSLEGQTGAGKTTLVKAYARSVASYDTVVGTYVPTFYVQCPSPATVKGLASVMLAQLGDPMADKGTLWSMNGRLINLIRACGVQIVILDDFHHLIDSETDRVLAVVSDWLKTLIKATNIPYIVVGITGKNERILRANLQLSRLFAVRESLDAFIWNPNDEDSIRRFATLITYAERIIDFKLSDELTQVEMLYRIHYATAGVMSHLMNLLHYAALLAKERDSATITVAMLYEAFNKRLSRHLYRKINPFDSKFGSQFIAPGAPAINQENAVSRRSKRRKKDDDSDESIANTLTTK